MTAAAPAKKLTPSGFEDLPQAELGQMVLWYPQGDTSVEPLPAIVSAMSPTKLCLNIIRPNTYNFYIVDGVAHRDAREVKERRPWVTESGCWEHTQFTKKVLALEGLLQGK